MSTFQASLYILIYFDRIELKGMNVVLVRLFLTYVVWGRIASRYKKEKLLTVCVIRRSIIYLYLCKLWSPTYEIKTHLKAIESNEFVLWCLSCLACVSLHLLPHGSSTKFHSEQCLQTLPSWQQTLLVESPASQERLNRFSLIGWIAIPLALLVLK